MTPQPYALTQLTHEQWEYLLHLVKANRAEIERVVMPSRVKDRTLEFIGETQTEIERTISVTEFGHGKK